MVERTGGAAENGLPAALARRVRGAFADGGLWAVLLLSTVMLFINITTAREFYADDEYLYAKIAAEMLRRGDLWTPVWLDKPAFFKPPLTYWLMMAGYKIGGISLTSARLPIACTGILTSLFVYLLGRRLYGRRAALLSGVLLSTSFGYLAYGRVGMMDMPLALFITAGVYSFYRAFEDGSKLHAAAFFAVAGTSTLIKGPISALILLLFAALTLLFLGRWRRLLNLHGLCGAVTGLAAAGAWPLAMYLRGDWDYWFRFFILRENLGKFTDQHYSSLALLSYIPQYIFPWSLLLPAALLTLFIRRRAAGLGFTLPVIWMFSATAVFLFPATKLPWYMVPALPAAALLMGGAYSKYADSRLLRACLRATALIGLALTIGMLMALRLFHGSAAALLLVPGLALGAALTVFLARCELEKSALAYAGLLVLLILAGASFTYDRLPPEAAALIAPGSAPVGVVRKQVYLYSYYLDRPVTQLADAGQVADILAQRGHVISGAGDLSAVRRSDFEIGHAWKEWKEQITLREILQAVRDGDPSGLQEPVYLIQAPVSKAPD